MAFEVGSALLGLAGVVIGGAISGGTTWLIANSDRNRFARERTWDLRREAYTEIVAHLMAADSWAKIIDERYSEDSHGYDASDDLREHGKQLSHYYQNAKSKYTMSRLILSDEFSARFETMMTEMGELDNNQALTPPEVAQNEYEIINEAVTELMRIGFRETVSGLA